MSVHVGLNSLALLQWADEEQKQRFLAPQARGEKFGTFALTEPNAGSDAGSIESTYVRDGDAMSSTAPRCGSRWPTSPITSWSSPRLTVA